MQEHQTNKATLQTFQPTYPYYRRPFSLTTIIWVPLGRLVPPGRFGTSWNIPLSVNIPLTVGDILYTPAGRIMRDERLLVIILYTPAERFLGDERLPAIYIPLFSECSGRFWRQCDLHQHSNCVMMKFCRCVVFSSFPSKRKWKL